MTKRNEISVIIPVWNGEKTLDKAIESCLKQTLRPKEILVCDDGSTDKSKAIVKSFKSRRVRWIPGKHSGLPAIPRNRGLKKAKGEWLAFLDADDEWLPRKLEKQIITTRKTGCLAICSNAYRKTNNADRKTHYFDFPEKHLTLGNLIITNLVICSSMMLHRSIIKHVGMFPENNSLRSVEDYAFWLRIATQTKIFYLNQPSVIYNDKPQLSIRSKIHTNHRLLKIQVLKNFLFWLIKNKYENIAHC